MAGARSAKAVTRLNGKVFDAEEWEVSTDGKTFTYSEQDAGVEKAILVVLHRLPNSLTRQGRYSEPWSERYQYFQPKTWRLRRRSTWGGNPLDVSSGVSNASESQRPYNEVNGVPAHNVVPTRCNIRR
jgi:hypothetical protein